ncbi:hypothetical protein [Aminobacter aminovorans]|uniref:hypothetical protein n=1 Tax=Aminobacter aminovorans TaxID=83263 RepID=UPI00286071BA|nr:hypothetical protein [Aminobacter aminovorans]MDR7221680.1 hypothetical protein [Aminobacter aminovorans]
MTDILAGLALLASIGTFLWTLQLERRIRSRSEKREAFDGWITSPAEASFQGLSLCIAYFSAALKDNSADTQKRADALRKIQTTEFENWYFDLDGLFSSKADPIITQLDEETQILLDGILEIVNDASEPHSEAELSEYNRKLMKLKHSYLSNCRAYIQAQKIGLR